MYLGFIWLIIIAFSLFLYFMLDGFTLGAGILLPFMNNYEKDLIISILLPTWDSNQTWLVFALASFYGMFSIGFAYIFPKIYLPAILLAIMMLLRGVCFEFRLKSSKNFVKNWDRLFFISSFVIIFIHGYILGRIIIGFQYTYVYKNIFCIFIGLILLFSYSLLGAVRLIFKTEGELLNKSKKFVKILSFLMFIFILFINECFLFNMSISVNDSCKNCLFLVLFMLTIIAFLILNIIIRTKFYIIIPWFLIVSFISMYINILILVFPYIIPYQITYFQAESSDTTLSFTLWSAIIMIPFLLIYNSYVYYIFRGKIKDKLNY